jgi:hypothetical protein
MTQLKAFSNGLAISILYTRHFTMFYSFQEARQGGILEFQWCKLVKTVHKVQMCRSAAIMLIGSIGVLDNQMSFFGLEGFFNNMLLMLGPQ